MPVGLSPATAPTNKSKPAEISTRYFSLSILGSLAKAAWPAVISLTVGGLFRWRASC
jgi:hypothetical protein